jgi:lysozyme family protein
MKDEFPFVIDLGREMALASIGKSASLECLRRLALESERWGDGKLTDKAAMMIRVIRRVEGDEVATFMFERTIAKETDENHKRNLEDALKYLNRRIEMDAQDERREPEPTPTGTSIPAPTVTDSGRTSGTPNAAGTGTSSEGGAEDAVAQASPFPWAIVVVVAIAALSLGAITTLLLTRRKKA